jgi:hypothetical protein
MQNNPLDRLHEAATNPEVMNEINASLSADPAPMFCWAFMLLRALPDKVDAALHVPDTVRLSVSNQIKADASVERTKRFPSAFKITVNTGFYYLLEDLSEVTVAQEAMYSRTGELLTDVSLSPSDLTSILEKGIRDYVTNDHDWNSSGALVDNARNRTRRERDLSVGRRREWVPFARRLHMIVFTLGHELGHIVKGHFRWQPPWRRMDAKAEELEADSIAAKLLIDFLNVPPLWWADRWDEAGDALTDLMTNGVRLSREKHEYFHGITDLARVFDGLNRGRLPAREATPFEVALASALTSIAALFAVFQATEKARAALGIKDNSGYPSAKVRYQAFRTLCIEKLRVPEEAFTSFRGLVSSPDHRFQLFEQLLEHCVWNRTTLT